MLVFGVLGSATVCNPISQLLAALCSCRASYLIKCQYEDLSDHLAEVFLYESEVLAANFIHRRELFDYFAFSMDALFFTYLEVGEDFLLRKEHTCGCLRSRTTLARELELLDCSDSRRARKIVIIVTTQGNAKQLAQEVLYF